jgi:hypothetical protein
VTLVFDHFLKRIEEDKMSGVAAQQALAKAVSLKKWTPMRLDKRSSPPIVLSHDPDRETRNHGTPWYSQAVLAPG